MDNVWHVQDADGKALAPKLIRPNCKTMEDLAYNPGPSFKLPELTSEMSALAESCAAQKGVSHQQLQDTMMNVLREFLEAQAN